MKQKFVYVAISAVISLMNVGCGSTYIPSGDSFSSVAFAFKTQCEEELYGVFSSKIHSFLRTNCSTCHASGGSSGVYFANPNAVQSFTQFQLTGIDKWQTYALSAHQAGITGPQHQSVVDDAAASWRAVENSAVCGGAPPVDLKATTVDKVMAATATNKVIAFNLDTESDRMNQFGGAIFEISVRTMMINGSQPAYYISSPRLRGPTNAAVPGVYVNGFAIRINGVRYDLGTTYLETSGYAATGANIVLSTSTLVKQMPSGTAASDTIGVEFLRIEAGPQP